MSGEIKHSGLRFLLDNKSVLRMNVIGASLIVAEGIVLVFLVGVAIGVIISEIKHGI